VGYRSVVPTNLFGHGDNYHPKNSHVIPALIRRGHEAKVNQAPSVIIRGTATPRREFLCVDDMATASVHVMNLPKPVYEQHNQPMLSHVNGGCGHDITIRELGEAISWLIGSSGNVLSCASRSRSDRGLQKKFQN
jgi:GDP-L-fucose synthase